MLATRKDIFDDDDGRKKGHLQWQLKAQDFGQLNFFLPLLIRRQVQEVSCAHCTVLEDLEQEKNK